MALSRNTEHLHQLLTQAEKTLSRYEARLHQLRQDKEMGKAVSSTRIQHEEDAVTKFREIMEDLNRQLSGASQAEKTIRNSQPGGVASRKPKRRTKQNNKALATEN